MSLPDLFPKGVFTPLNDAALAVLSDDERARYAEVVRANDVATEAKMRVQELSDRVAMCGGQVDAAKKYLRENFKPLTQKDLMQAVYDANHGG